MFTASSGIYVIDTFLKPFFKIWEKSPLVMLFLVIVLYSIIAYIVIKSAFMSDHSNQY